jgi:hypothetical protein
MLFAKVIQEGQEEPTFTALVEIEIDRFREGRCRYFTILMTFPDRTLNSRRFFLRGLLVRRPRALSNSFSGDSTRDLPEWTTIASVDIERHGANPPINLSTSFCVKKNAFPNSLQALSARAFLRSPRSEIRTSNLCSSASRTCEVVKTSMAGPELSTIVCVSLIH